MEFSFDKLDYVTETEPTKLLFIGRYFENNELVFYSCDLTAEKLSIVYSQKTNLDTDYYVPLSTGQFAILFKELNGLGEEYTLRILTFKNQTANVLILDIKLALKDLTAFYEIKYGKYRNHLLLYSNQEFIIVDLQGQIQRKIALSISPFINFNQIQELTTNELILHYDSGLMHLNLVSAEIKLIDCKKRLEDYYFTNFLNPETIILRQCSYVSNHNNQLLAADISSLSFIVIASFNEEERCDDTHALNNGNLTVTILNKKSGKYRYEFYRFLDKQFIPHPLLFSDEEENRATPANKFKLSK